MCLTGACPRGGSAGATHPTPAPSSPCSGPPAPSWAHWPPATLLSELRREQGRPAHRVGGKAVLTLDVWAVRNGLWPPDVVGGDEVELQHSRASLVWLVCSSDINTAPVKGFISTAWFLGHSLESASAPPPSPSLLPTDCGRYDFALLNSLIPAMLGAEAVRNMYLPSLKDVRQPWSKGPGSQFLSLKVRGQGQCSCPHCSLK